VRICSVHEQIEIAHGSVSEAVVRRAGERRTLEQHHPNARPREQLERVLQSALEVRLPVPRRPVDSLQHLRKFRRNEVGSFLA
jgi:hypothetical protein